MPPRTDARRSGAKRSDFNLCRSLLLNRFMLGLFGATSFEALGEFLKDPALEGYGEDNISLFHTAIVSRLGRDPELTPEKLLAYDRNIYRHTEHISRGRGIRIRWKYFQYMSLLFTEIYLDRYFNSRDRLLADIRRFQKEVYNLDPETWHDMSDFSDDTLNKLAYWSATGSGKTLLMHVNILQYRHYAEGHVDINRTILVTPNAGLSRQHLEEFALSDIPAKVFSRSSDSDSVDIIEITKLAETDGDKTVSIGAFEANNLVLVDEGHRGSSGDIWKTMRDRLSAEGFAFEYSATFGQAVASQSNPGRKAEMLNEYGRAIIFDYSFRYFHNDGYGKDYHILNLGDATRGFSVTKYLTACLLGFYEQMRLYLDHSAGFKAYMIEKPLAVFVGSTVSVSSSRYDWQREMSDIVYLLHFFQHFVRDSREATDIIAGLLDGTDGLVDRNNNPIFRRSLRYLRSLRMDAESIYRDMLRLLFNCDFAGAALHLDNLSGADGEIGMRIGNAPYFGIISVGDSAAVINKCAEAGISTMTMDYNEKSLFASINSKESTLNVLIGSRKFTEGWSSWRVSTMGLLNVGRSEGSQIVQLFGRGVRLKGYGYSLKRSSALDPSTAPGAAPGHIGVLETLNIFGIRADYIDLFKAVLQEEGLPAHDSDMRHFTLPIRPTPGIDGSTLKYLRIKEGKDFKREVVVNLDTDGVGHHIITLDCYPKVSAMRSDIREDAGRGGQNEEKFTPRHLQFIDWNKVFFSIAAFKKEREWYNLSLSPKRLKKIAYNPDWYRLLIPAYDMAFNDCSRNIPLWQEIVTTLLKMYVERVYTISRRRFITGNLEVSTLSESDSSFESEYHILYHKDYDEIADRLKEVKDAIENGTFDKTVSISGTDFQALYIGRHLYQPLLYIYDKHAADIVRVSPEALNEGERDFVNSIQRYYDSNPGFFADKQLYLLRNKSRQGIGFYGMAGYYPDFIVWLIVGHKQYISFVDPKGITHLRSFADDKVQLYRKLRTDIGPRLNDADVVLNSFIISDTPFSEVSHWAAPGSAEHDGSAYKPFNDHHIYFQKEQGSYYIDLMFQEILNT